MRPLIIRCAVVAALGGFLFGFDTAVISGTTEQMTQIWGLSSGMLGFTVSSALLGTIVGAATGGFLSDRYGRRPLLFTMAILFLISALGCAFAPELVTFIVARIVGGIAIGWSSVIAPIYTAEISPAEYRGRLVATVQFNIVIGIVIAYLSNWAIRRLSNPSVDWRIMLGIEAVPAFLFFVLLFTIPESPRWLYAHGYNEKARGVLDRLFGNAHQEEERILAALQVAKETNRVKVPFFTKNNSGRISMAIAIAAFSQVAGTNAILYYAPSLLKQSGIPGDSAFLAAVLVGITNVIFTMLGMSLIDKVGRRPLVITGAIIKIFALVFVAVIFATQGENLSVVSGMLVLGAIVVFIAALAAGIGSVLWVFISEIFPTNTRARGQSVGSLSHWIASALISGLFPVMFEFSKVFTFGFYAACMVGLVIWALTVMPETKGTALKEM